jgi:HAD superfamily hydrolase (TIGR01509 family)
VRKTVASMMTLAGLDPYVDFYLSNEDVERPKPDPQIFTLAMQRLDLKPSQCLILEDNEYGLEAARLSGAHVMAINSPADVSYPRIVEAMAELGE